MSTNTLVKKTHSTFLSVLFVNQDILLFLVTDDGDVKGAKKTCLKSDGEDLGNASEKQYIYTEEDAEELLES